MPGKNLTLYIPEEDIPIVQRAKKLLAFYTDTSLSAALVEKAKEVVARYDAIGLANVNQPIPNHQQKECL